MIYLLLIISTASSTTCKALVLSGGGSHGSYEAGVVNGLTYNSQAEDIAYNVVVGISTGAINSLLMSRFPMGQEFQASLGLTKI